jgi:1-acyl-sn-glycerol-3-phosphate acyltransferase
MDQVKSRYRFKKNARGFSEISFPFLRLVIINGCKIVFRPQLVNPHNMPKTGPCFVYGNHSNYVDPFLVNTWMTDEPTAGVMTREQFHKTIPSMFMDSIGIVPTSKYVPEPGVIRSVMKMIEQRRMIVIFPEAGRRWDGRPKPFLESTIKLFHKMKIPVNPVQIHGSYLTWPRWATFPRYGRTEIHFMDPIHPLDYPDYDTFAKLVTDAAEFEEYNPPESCIPKWAFRPADGVERFIYRCPITGVSGAVFSPDGYEVRSRKTNFVYTMTPASRLCDQNGEIHSLHDMFDAIRAMPIVAKDGLVASVSGSELFHMGSDYRLNRIGLGSVKFWSDHLAIEVNSEKTRILLSDILYMSIEGNNKLSLTLRTHTLQIELEGLDCALEWRDYLTRLKAGEKTVHTM